MHIPRTYCNLFQTSFLNNYRTTPSFLLLLECRSSAFKWEQRKHLFWGLYIHRQRWCHGNMFVLKMHFYKYWEKNLYLVPLLISKYLMANTASLLFTYYRWFSNSLQQLSCCLRAYLLRAIFVRFFIWAHLLPSYFPLWGWVFSDSILKAQAEQ